MLPENEIIGSFDGVRERGRNQWSARCPIHNDKEPSLSIKFTDENWLFYCHVCSGKTESENTTYFRDLLNYMSWKFSDVSAKDSEVKYELQKSAVYLKDWGGKYTPVTYPYTDEKGNVVYYKARFERTAENGEKEKTFRHGVVEDGVFKIVSEIKGDHIAFYRTKNIAEAYEKGKSIFITEGEKDVNTCRKLGLYAVTAGAAKSWEETHALFFKGSQVVILGDNDDAGKRSAEDIAKSLHNIAFSVKVVCPSKLEKGDVTDYFEKEGGSYKGLMQMIEDTPTVFADWVETKNEKCGRDADGRYIYKNTYKGINEDILVKTFIEHSQFLVVDRKGVENKEIYTYENGAYNLTPPEKVKSEIKRFIPMGKATSQKLNAAYNLLLSSDLKGKECKFEEFNSNGNYMNFKNGIYSIREKKLLLHTPENKSTLQLQCNYNMSADCPSWKKFINEMCRNADGETDDTKVKLLQEVAGFILSDIPIAKIKQAFILYSTVGDTGKSVFINVLTKLIGEEGCASIQLSRLGERFQTSGLYGKKLVSSSELNSADISDSSMFKSLTGGDPIQVEPKGKQPFSYTFTGKLLFACNDLPQITDDKGVHVYDRLNIIPLFYSVSGSEIDRNLTDKLLKELDGIALWALEGLQRLIANKLVFTKCETAEELKENYRKESDTVYDFLSERYEITHSREDRVPCTEMHEQYFNFCKERGRIPVGKMGIKKRFEKCGVKILVVRGIRYYFGITYSENPPKEFLQ